MFDGVETEELEAIAKTQAAEIARLQAKLEAVEKILLGNIGSDNARIAKALLTVQQQTDK